MKISITLGEALNGDIDWSQFCEMFGWNEYCIAEGCDPETIQEMTKEQAGELGLL